MSDMNKVIIIGKLGRDPETKRTKSNQTIVLFPFVTSEVWTNSAGEARVRETWHRVAVFSEFLCRIARGLREGSRCSIEGQIQTRKWFGKDDQPDTVSVEIVLQGIRAALAVLDPPSEGASRQRRTPTTSPEMGSALRRTRTTRSMPLALPGSRRMTTTIERGAVL